MQPVFIGMNNPQWSLLPLNGYCVRRTLTDRATTYDLGLMTRTYLIGRTVVLLGQMTRERFNRALNGQLPALLFHPQEVAGCTWRQLPHPSDHSTWYSNPDYRKVVEMLVRELTMETV